MLKKRRAAAVIAVLLLGWTGSAVPAHAAPEPDHGTRNSQGTSGGGHTVHYVTESYPVNGRSKVGADYGSDPGTPTITWDSSYAYSQEVLWVGHHGFGKAAGNVYSGERIVGVCFWWERGGNRITGETCSHAWSDGSMWHPGPDVDAWGYDTLDWNAPQTTFTIRTARINPRIY